MYIRKTIQNERQDRLERDESFESLGDSLLSGVDELLQLQGEESFIQLMGDVRLEINSAGENVFTSSEDEQDLIFSS